MNLPYDVFEIPFVDTCIMVFQSGGRQTPGDSIRVLTMGKREASELESIDRRLQNLPFATIEADRQLRLVLRAEAMGVLGALSACPFLSAAARLKRGIESYQYEIATTQRSGRWRPFFDGKVDRFTAVRTNAPAFVNIKPAEAGWHTGSRIVVRRLVSRANRLMAARLDGEMVVKKDLYVVQSDGTSLSLLLGLLNSALLSYVYLVRSAAATKDDFRQVSLEGLRGLPFPNDRSNDAEICRYTELIEKLASKGRDWAAEDAALDALVFDAFGIGENDRGDIFAFLRTKG